MDATRTIEQGFLRHLRACNNAVLPGAYRPVRIGTAQVGWIAPATLTALAGAPGLHVADGAATLDPARLDGLAQALADRRLGAVRGELFDVRAAPDATVLGRIDRGALPALGIAADGVHLNGLVRRGAETLLWVARRAAGKAVDPGKLDHLAAGGVPSGLTPWQCLLKEAEEEAALPPSLTAQARHVATIRYAMQRREGLRRDRLLVYDLDLPDDFVPHPADGEAQDFALWPLQRALEAVRDTDDFKFNVSLVLIDLFLRHGLIGPHGVAGGRPG